MPASDISLMKGFIRQESLVQSRYRQTLGLAVVILTVSIWGTWYFEVPLTFQTSSPTICFPIFGGALGLAALGNGLFDYWRQRKIGLPVFDYVPTHAGGHLRGAVLLDRNIETKGDFKVKLKCFQYTIDAQGERSRSPSLRWTGEAVQPKEHVLSKKRLEVSFQLPPRKVLVTSPGNIFWKLEVRAPMTGINFFAAFSLRGTNRGRGWLDICAPIRAVNFFKAAVEPRFLRNVYGSHQLPTDPRDIGCANNEERGIGFGNSVKMTPTPNPA